jgi:hypothetical protein
MLFAAIYCIKIMDTNTGTWTYAKFLPDSLDIDLAMLKFNFAFFGSHLSMA